MPRFPLRGLAPRSSIIAAVMALADPVAPATARSSPPPTSETAATLSQRLAGSITTVGERGVW